RTRRARSSARGRPAGCACAWRRNRTSVPRRKSLAERTGLEPATPGVTGRYSNQLNYRSLICIWWVLTGSNRRHSPCKSDALPAELSTLKSGGLTPSFEGALVYSVLECLSSPKLG